MFFKGRKHGQFLFFCFTRNLRTERMNRMKTKPSLWNSVSVLVVAVLVIAAFIRGDIQIWLYAAVFAAWAVWVSVRYLIPYAALRYDPHQSGQPADTTGTAKGALHPAAAFPQRFRKGDCLSGRICPYVPYLPALHGRRQEKTGEYLCLQYRGTLWRVDTVRVD